jgi:hypothetical protein
MPERPDEESLPKKPLRDHDPPWPPDEEPPGGHAALAGAPEATPGGFAAQFWPGISAKAPPPTAKLPISSSATWFERLTG